MYVCMLYHSINYSCHYSWRQAPTVLCLLGSTSAASINQNASAAACKMIGNHGYTSLSWRVGVGLISKSLSFKNIFFSNRRFSPNIRRHNGKYEVIENVWLVPFKKKILKALFLLLVFLCSCVGSALSFAALIYYDINKENNSKEIVLSFSSFW